MTRNSSPPPKTKLLGTCIHLVPLALILPSSFVRFSLRPHGVFTFPNTLIIVIIMFRVFSTRSTRSGFTILKFQVVLFECFSDKHGDTMTSPFEKGHVASYGYTVNCQPPASAPSGPARNAKNHLAHGYTFLWQPICGEKSK